MNEKPNDIQAGERTQRTAKEIQREISSLGFPNRGSQKMLRQEELRHELRSVRESEKMQCPIKISITDLDGIVLGVYDLSLLNEEEILSVHEDIERDIEIYSKRAKRGLDLASGRAQ